MQYVFEKQSEIALSKLGIARLPIHHLRSIQATLCCYGIAGCIVLSRMYRAEADFTSRKSTFICLEKAFYLTETTTQSWYLYVYVQKQVIIRLQSKV